MQTLQNTLQNYFGFSTFKQSQEQVIQSILSNKNTLAILPTGGGKSLCYQIPTLHTAAKCLVVSPLIALIKDQVLGLRNRNISALAIHSGMSSLEIEETYKKFDAPNQHFLFVSPERLKSKLFLDYLQDWPITFLAIDEAHCISQWGYDFRPAYLEIVNCLPYIPQATIIALTASATQIVADDICQKLNILPSIDNTQNFNVIKTSVVRTNLHLQVQCVEDKINAILEILHFQKGTALIYCKNRKTTVQISEALQGQNINCKPYHAGMEMQLRNKIQEDWINGDVPIVACTEAFGMGIDKANVRLVIHYNFSESLEAYYQEIGRAGRDGLASQAILLYTQNDVEGIDEKIALRYPNTETVFDVYEAICNYYRIALDEGENIWLDFDLVEVCNAINKPTFLVHNALHILKMQEYIMLSEGMYISSRVMVTCGRADLEFLEKTQPHLDNILKAILRLYSGVFRGHSTIHENKIASFAEVEIHTVKPALEHLHQLQIIDYVTAKDKPQIMLTEPRVRHYDFNPNLELINFLRDRYAEKLKASVAYVTNNKVCRMQILSNYFGETNTIPCGKCDVCNKAYYTSIKSTTFNNLHALILQTIAVQNKITIKELFKYIDLQQHANAEIVLQFLINNNKVNLNKIGELQIN